MPGALDEMIRLFNAGLLSTVERLEPAIGHCCIEVLALPASDSSNWSMALSSIPILMSTSLTFCSRSGSLEAFQLGFLTRTASLLRVYDLSSYGPSDHTAVSYVRPLSCAFGTADHVGIAVVSLKSATGWFRWKTMVYLSGVWMESSDCPLYGPV